MHFFLVPLQIGFPGGAVVACSCLAVVLNPFVYVLGVVPTRLAVCVGFSTGLAGVVSVRDAPMDAIDTIRIKNQLRHKGLTRVVVVRRSVLSNSQPCKQIEESAVR